MALHTPYIKNSESWQIIILKLTPSISSTEMLSLASGICNRNSSYKMQKAAKIAFSLKRLFLERLGSFQLFTVLGRECHISPSHQARFNDCITQTYSHHNYLATEMFIFQGVVIRICFALDCFCEITLLLSSIVLKYSSHVSGLCPAVLQGPIDSHLTAFLQPTLSLGLAFPSSEEFNILFRYVNAPSSHAIQ